MGSTRVQPRYPVHDLLVAAGAEGLHELARAIAVSYRRASQDSILRVLTKGDMTETTADRYACAVGWHPGAVWPEWWDIELDPADLVAS